MEKVDYINNAPHYVYAAVEPIAAIEAWGLGFCLGNVVKYVARHKYKNGLEDLRKARWYLDREIENYGRDASPSNGVKPQLGTKITPRLSTQTAELGQYQFVGCPHGSSE